MKSLYGAAKGVPPKNNNLQAAYLVAVYAIAVGITPEFNFLGIPKVRITDLLLPVILLACSPTPAANSKDPNQQMPLAGFFKLIIFWNICCLAFWGQAPWTPGLFYVAKRAIYFLVAYVAFKAVREVNVWNQVVRALVFASPILSFSVLHELGRNIDAGGILATGEGMRASGIIANQQTSTALYIAVISCIALGAWDAFKDARWRLGTVASLATGCAAIFATGSRGGLACVTLSLVLTAAQNPKRGIKLIIVALFFGAIAWQFTPPELRTRLAGILPETQATITGLTSEDGKLVEYGNSSITDRALVAQWAWKELIPKAGLIGAGAGFKNLGAIDDFYLTEWLYHGLIGMVLFAGLQIALFVGTMRIALRSKDPVEQGVASGVATAVVVMSASGIHADTFYLIRPMEALALLLGLVAARRAIGSQDAAPTLSAAQIRAREIMAPRRLARPIREEPPQVPGFRAPQQESGPV
jgi:hypothetical protein